MPKRPNIVVITTHDTGKHFGCYGIPSVRTPAIDALADDGCKFNQMFATSSICSPSRGSLLTGQWPQNNGLFGLAGGCWHWTMNDPKRHLSHVLRNAGYQTTHFGIQHETTNVPRDLGFDLINPNVESHPGRNQPTCTAAANGFAQYLSDRQANSSDQPFYAQIGFFETHTPYNHGDVEPDDTHGIHRPDYMQADANDEKLDKHIAHLQGAVHKVDEAVAIISKALRDAGEEGDTLVLFNTDHGPELPRAKWTMFDPGINIGFIMRWPNGGIAGGQTCDWMLSNTDFVPTLAELVGLDINHPLDGVSFASAFTNDSNATPPREELFALFVNAQLYCARTPRYKLIRNFAEGCSAPGVFSHKALLFDLEADPLELHNLADDPAHADALAEMNSRIWRWLESVNDPILQGPVPTPYYRHAIADYHAWKTKGQS